VAKPTKAHPSGDGTGQVQPQNGGGEDPATNIFCYPYSRFGTLWVTSQKNELNHDKFRKPRFEN